MVLGRAAECLTMEGMVPRPSGIMGESTGRHRWHVQEGLLRELKTPYARAGERTLVRGDTFVHRTKQLYLRGGERRWARGANAGPSAKIV